MKLIFCPVCEDVRKLTRERTECECRESYGYYTADGIDAVIGGKAIPLGFANSSLAAALMHRPADGMGEPFTAFVIPRKCSSIKQL